ncbi:MAG: ABC transporter ATP-binding protein, partial [Gammaproteobacteria bacterium]
MNTPTPDFSPPRYTWRRIIALGLKHKRELVAAHAIAIAAAIVSVPQPLLMPLMVDEVLLDKPGATVALLNGVLPEGWQGPVGYILGVLVVAVILRLGSTLLAVWQTQKFTTIAKDVTFHIRRQLLGRLERISMAEYET